MKKNKYKKILVLGSGALQIGQAGEFDYSGSQAIKAFKEEKIKVILINPNIATFQTSKTLADEVYFLPVNIYFVEQVIKKEKPDAITLSFGGQTALNCGLLLEEKGILKKYGVKIIGSPIASVELTEDRALFAKHLKSIGIPVPPSGTAHNLAEAKKIGEEIGFPAQGSANPLQQRNPEATLEHSTDKGLLPLLDAISDSLNRLRFGRTKIRCGTQ